MRRDAPLHPGRRRITVETVTREELKGKIDRGERFTLVETLQEVAYKHEHLPGAINLPPDRVRELAPGLLPDKGAEIIVYCSSPT
jgi:rhodanese-related sulfurtransferase